MAKYNRLFANPAAAHSQANPKSISSLSRQGRRGVDGAGLAKREASMATFGCTDISS